MEQIYKITVKKFEEKGYEKKEQKNSTPASLKKKDNIFGEKTKKKLRRGKNNETEYSISIDHNTSQECNSE